MLQLQPLKECHYPQVHRLMRLQNFPGTPKDFETAQTSFLQHDLYGLFNETNSLQAAIVLGENNGQCAFLDAMCHGHMRGKWLTRHTLRQLVYLCFGTLGLEYLWTQVHSPEALSLCLRLGFELCDGQPDQLPTLVTLRRTTVTHD